MEKFKSPDTSNISGEPKAIIFDLYGTLLRFDQKAFFNELNSAFNSVKNENNKQRLKGLLVENYESETEMYKDWCLAIGVDTPVDEHITLCRNIIEKHQAKISCYNGVRSLLSFFKRRGYKLALLSNSAQVFTYPVISLELDSFFDYISFSCNSGLIKPNISAYLSVCEKLKIVPEDCLFIGDSYENDYKVPLSIGMNSICLKNKTNKPNFTLFDIAFSQFNCSNVTLNQIVPSKIVFDSTGIKFNLFQTELLPDSQQGRYNLIGMTSLNAENQEEKQLYCKRYLLPESAYVEESAYHIMHILGMSDTLIKLLPTPEPILLSSPALGKLWTPSDLDEVTVEIIGSHCAVAYLIGNADLRPRNTFVYRNGNDIKVTIIDLEHCLFDRALDLRDCSQTCSPFMIDNLNHSIELRTKHRVLSPAATQRARRSFLPIENKDNVLAKLFRKGWLKIFKIARMKVNEIELYLSNRIYQTPFLIIGTQSYRRAMSSIDIQDMISRIMEDAEDSFEQHY